MFIKKNFTLAETLRFSGGHMIWITLWGLAATGLLEFIRSRGFEGFQVPWLPISLIGTAVAFYIGFKNNSSYDRVWEARKIWGGVVNVSRMWGTNIRTYVTNQFKAEHLSETELAELHQKLIYRHIAWLYTLRSQLLIPTEWEHINQGKFVARVANRRRATYGVGLYSDEHTQTQLENFLPKEETQRLINYKNTATQIIDQQSQDLKTLRELDITDDFRHVELQKLLNEFYSLQGKLERIKKFPLPRQYANMSFIFVGIFIFLLPFGLHSAFLELGGWARWLAVPFTLIVGWVFLTMELVGDYSENPFEGTGNDIPMLSLCRVIEIDLREMLGETDLPPAIEAKNGILM